MAKKEAIIEIKPDGTVDVDQAGWEGKNCTGAVDDLLKQIGSNVKSTRNKDYNRGQKVRINQHGG